MVCACAEERCRLCWEEGAEDEREAKEGICVGKRVLRIELRRRRPKRGFIYAIEEDM